MYCLLFTSKVHKFHTYADKSNQLSKLIPATSKFPYIYCLIFIIKVHKFNETMQKKSKLTDQYHQPQNLLMYCLLFISKVHKFAETLQKMSHVLCVASKPLPFCVVWVLGVGSGSMKSR